MLFGTRYLAYIYLAFVSTSVVGEILSWLISPFFAAYAKFFIYPSLAIIFIEFILKKKLLNQLFIYSMLFLMLFGISTGLIRNSVGKSYFAHFLPFLLAIFAYSYGYRSELKKISFIDIVDKYSIKAGYILVGFVLLYFILFKLNIVQYFGAGALFAYPIFYAVSKKLYQHAFIFYAANIFTGKRSVFFVISIVLFIYLFFKLNNFWRLFLTLLLIILMYFSAKLGMESGGIIFDNSFDRYISLFHTLSEYDDIPFAIDLATSGRYFDALAVIDKLGINIYNWLFGMGFGATYDIVYSFHLDETHSTHYSHVTPLSYLFLGGIALLIAVYGKLLKETFYSFKNTEDHISLMMIYFLIISVSGAALFSDVFWWLIIGSLSARRMGNPSSTV